MRNQKLVVCIVELLIQKFDARSEYESIW